MNTQHFTRNGALAAIMLLGVVACSPASPPSAEQAAKGPGGQAMLVAANANCSDDLRGQCQKQMQACIDECSRLYKGDAYKNCVHSDDGCKGRYDACMLPCN